MKDADSVAKTHFATGARPAPAGAGAQGDDAQPPGAPPDAYVGRLIGERYRILARLGEGGMGLVFRGEHVLMKKPVAIKLLHRELGSLDDAVKRFEREAQSASRLSHPSIVGVTDFGRAESGELFLVMEFVPGVHLGDYLERTGRLSPLKALSVCRMILRGLAHAHQAGVVHRDLKPANVMLVERDGEPRRIEGVKILDFGIAKMTESAGTAEVALTPGRDDLRDPKLHVSRASHGRTGRSPHRHLRLRRHVVRDAGRAKALRGGRPREDHGDAGHGPSALLRQSGAQVRHPCGARTRGHAGPGKGAPASLRVRHRLSGGARSGRVSHSSG
ncbi:MAG: serine/threonine protein kinase [Myxococcales bacterium]|nr:serine/threonine protein kinase [Myxococcales bacterium]